VLPRLAVVAGCSLFDAPATTAGTRRTNHGALVWRFSTDTLKTELARVRDGAADLLQQLTADAPAVAENRPTGGAAIRRSRGRSGGIVDAPGKKHRAPMPTDPGANRADSQAAKMRAAKTMVKTSRHRGRG
jgi:hypothetical protein